MPRQVPSVKLILSTFSVLSCSASLLATPAIAGETASTAQSSSVGAKDDRTGAYFQTNGTRIFYQLEGNGQPLLLIHGYPLSGALFENVRHTLSQHFKVITPDLPGFGKSTLGTAKGGDTNYAKEMLALLDHLGMHNAVIGGHSMGGQITLEMYRLAPTRFTAMILFDTNPAKASIVESHEFLAFPDQDKTDGIASIAKFVVPQMITGPSLLNDTAEANSVTSIIQEASFDGIRAGAFTLALRPDYTTLLDTIKTPTLVIVGIDDQIYAPPISMMAANQIAGASLTIVPAAAHAPMVERPKYVVQAIMSWARMHKL